LSTQINNLDETFELEKLQSELSSRQSVVHFARTGVAMFLAAIVAGAAGKQCWDLPEGKLYLALPAIVLALSLLTYSLVHYVKGKRCRAVEQKRFGHMMNLRRALKLDDPSALLPR
jgi:hypothetical protein